MKAAEQLSGEGLNVRVLDPFTIKPLDSATIIKNAQECGGRIVVTEDHYYEGKRHNFRQFFILYLFFLF